jgi:molecular chaperone HtpG
VIDNGTGMDQYIIDSYYSKVGSSFYKSSDFYDLRSESKADFIPTSRFGIGILSCFMVADTLIVDTKRAMGPHNSSDSINLTIEGQESIFWIKQGSREKPGTTTRLTLRKKKNPWNRMNDDEFIKSVENVIPNPPFSITIECANRVKIIDENSFKSISAHSLKKGTWISNENIREIEVSIRNEEGILGSIIVGILENKGKPVEKIDITSKSVEIENESYDLEKSFILSNNKIQMNSTTITINNENEIEQSTSPSTLVKSKSRFSLHGIEIPTTLFPDSWNVLKNQVQIIWPLPVLLVIDVSGSRDLDLNSSRTQVISSDKWFKFEEDLAYLICKNISSSVDKVYWDSLKEILLKNSKNEYFLNGLSRVN